jgi:hypothetical protein
MPGGKTCKTLPPLSRPNHAESGKSIKNHNTSVQQYGGNHFLVSSGGFSPPSLGKAKERGSKTCKEGERGGWLTFLPWQLDFRILPRSNGA